MPLAGDRFTRETILWRNAIRLNRNLRLRVLHCTLKRASSAYSVSFQRYIN